MDGYDKVDIVPKLFPQNFSIKLNVIKKISLPTALIMLLAGTIKQNMYVDLLLSVSQR